MPNTGFRPCPDVCCIARAGLSAAHTVNWGLGGEPLERSWGYGVRSYGPGSRLHMHRDRVDTHVLSCIVHVANQSVGRLILLTMMLNTIRWSSSPPRPWAFALMGELWFDGNFYRNMYSLRPKLGTSPYKQLTNTFADIDEARQSMGGWRL